MEPQKVENSRNSKQLYNILDIASASCAIGGALLGTVMNSAAYAAFPLAGAVGMHLYNRRRLMEAMNQHTDKLIRQQNLHIVNHQTHIQTLSEQLLQLQQEFNRKLEQENQSNQASFAQKEQQIGQLNQLIVEANQFTQGLEAQHQQLADIVGELRQIENFSQALRSNPSLAEMYYQRGMSYQRLGDKQGAIADFTQAVFHDSRSAKAYHSRGVLSADLGNRKSAVYDLREAAKLYFETGDIESYQKARDLCKEYYDLGLATVTAEVVQTEETLPQPVAPEGVLVGNLFDCN